VIHRLIVEVLDFGTRCRRRILRAVGRWELL
jgi:hypothetical protein